MRFQSMRLGASVLAIAVCSAGVAAAQTPGDAPDPTAPPPGEGSPSIATTPMAPTPTAEPMATSLPLAEQPQADVVKRSWPNRPLLITGVVVLGGTYGASAIVGAVSDRKADEKLFYPVVGPWLDLKARDCEVNDCGNDTFNKALLIADGALQGLGALGIILGLTIPESEEKPWYLIGDEDLLVAPQVGLALTGVTAVGRF